ncbi:hypothetical protein K9L67_01730, partial [Candidatus Woesearchaeota archaeon]|nr:hypothetical protein [Candidatus Woesearchaeota archaeon]
LKKNRVDKGPGGRKKQDRRIAYNINKEQNMLVSLNASNTCIKQIKDAPVTQIFLNCIQNDLQEHIENFIKLYCATDVSDLIGAYFIEGTEKDLHILVITNNVQKYRDNSKLIVDVQNKKKMVSFWSHSPVEFREGLEKKEEYFLDKEKKALLVLGKPLKDALEGTK